MKYVVTLYVGLMMFAYSALAQAIVPADVFVKSVADEVLTIIKKDKDIQNGDQAKIFALVEEKIVPNFNFDHVCKLVLGKNFSKATKDQQDAFEREFRTLLIRTYAGALSQVKDQTVQLRPFRMSPEDTEVVVRTQVIGKGDPIQLDYRLEKTANNVWRVYDLNVLGAWLVEAYRGQFNNQISQSGIDGLITFLQERNKTLSKAK